VTPVAPQPAPWAASMEDAAARAVRLSEVYERTLAVIREELETDATLDTPLAALGDSLALIVVAYAIEEALGIEEIPDAELRACVTVGDLARAAERGLAAKAVRP
jgi:acyl carrier protein